MELLALDVRTLAFVSSIGGFVMAATLFALHMAGTRQPGLLYWATGGLCFGTGYLMGHLLVSLPDGLPAWFYVAMANSLIAAFHLAILLGIQRYLGLRMWGWWLLLPWGVLVASMFLVPAMREVFVYRLVAQTVWYIAVDTAAAVLLWRAVSPGLTSYRRAAAGVLLAYVAFMLMRLVITWAGGGTASAMIQSPMQMATFLASMLLGFLLTMALVVMVFRERELRMQEVARHDPLTGLFNRYALGALSARELSRAERHRQPLSLVSLDLDRFKDINDTKGHAAGDRVLVGVAQVLTDTLRDIDLVFRIGGEEFLAVLPNTPGSAAVKVAERLRQAIGAGAFRADGAGSVHVTASVGVCEVDTVNESWDAALVRVDRALYAAKAAGRDRVHFDRGGDAPRGLPQAAPA